ncbi:MAG TPA: sortase [Patescibacteria group bacterium]|nr:sortase [Patescibacteria group bacterium]
MKKKVIFVLYIGVLLLIYIMLPKMELILQKRQANIILEKYNVIKYREIALPIENSLISLEQNDISDNTNVSINSDAKVNVNATFDANIVDIYKPIGILEIPSLNIKYPILNKTTDGALKLSVTAYAGKINEINNFVIAGHNYKNDFAFGKLKYVQKGDVVKIEGVEYKVFDIFVVDETAVSLVIKNDTQGERWVTLFTCTNSGKDRLVVRAKAI